MGLKLIALSCEAVGFVLQMSHVLKQTVTKQFVAVVWSEISVFHYKTGLRATKSGLGLVSSVLGVNRHVEFVLTY